MVKHVFYGIFAPSVPPSCLWYVWPMCPVVYLPQVSCGIFAPGVLWYICPRCLVVYLPQVSCGIFAPGVLWYICPRRLVVYLHQVSCGIFAPGVLWYICPRCLVVYLFRCPAEQPAGLMPAGRVPQSSMLMPTSIMMRIHLFSSLMWRNSSPMC